MLKSRDELMKLASSLDKVNDVKDRKNCSNLNCNAKTLDLVVPSSFARAYYGLPAVDDQAWKICVKCRLRADNYEQKSKREVKEKGNLFSLPFEAGAFLEIIDLDSTATPSSPAYTVSENVLTNDVNNILQKFSILEHVERCEETLSNNVTELVDNFGALEKDFEKASSDMDQILKKWNNYSSKYYPQKIELGTVDISQNGRVKVQESDRLSEKLNQLNLGGIPKAVIDFRRTVNVDSRNDAENKSFRQAAHCENTPPNSVPRNSSNRQLLFKPPNQHQMVYAMSQDSLYFWIPAKVVSVRSACSEDEKTTVCVRPQTIESYGSIPMFSPITTIRLGSQIAFSKPLPQVAMPVGSRVIAKFHDILGNNPGLKDKFFGGIIAETRNVSNGNRYLIFFDDGYPQYTIVNDVLPVFQPSKAVWEDVHPDVQKFTKDFLMKYQNLRLLRPVVDNRYKIEYNGKWLYARVVEIDCSLMMVQYPENSKLGHEWVYLGSPRIRAIYAQYNDGNGVTKEELPVGTVKPLEKFSRSMQSKFDLIGQKPLLCANHETAGSTNKIQIPRDCPTPKEHVDHVCSPVCALTYVEDDYRAVSPLVVPFYLGWAREFRGPKLGSVAYITPCGVRLTTYDEIHMYNSITKNNLPVEFFSLEPMIDCLNEFYIDRKLVAIKDISYGKEWTPVQCVNSLTFDTPDSLEYLSKRQPGEGVNTDFDDNFLVCCDCVDDCKDKTKCTCWQLTLSGISFKKKPSPRGYENRRLKDWIESGIYECNHKCKCRQNTCLNRVVQSKVKWPVQVFRTIKKGWGVRALYDIPKGSFLCVYTGKLLNDAGANQEGLQNGDEYLADLDYIEVMESRKEGYESDCSDIEDDANLNDENVTSRKSGGAPKMKLQVARKSTGGRMAAAARSNETKLNALSMNGKEKPSRAVPYRKYFGKSEKPYSVDGKGLGNFGRYFNHSCDPNLFIQTVFVDTHDLRFPWVAFFTCKDVKAGTELCWDYKYTVGSVPGKYLQCYCGSRNCRRRLL